MPLTERVSISTSGSSLYFSSNLTSALLDLQLKPSHALKSKLPVLTYFLQDEYQCITAG